MKDKRPHRRFENVKNHAYFNRYRDMIVQDGFGRLVLFIDIRMAHGAGYPLSGKGKV